MKQLIVTADDFGLSPAVNRAVVRAWQEGILTGASLLVTGPAAEEAITLAREHPGLQVGLHLSLVQGQAVMAHPGFPSLADVRRNFPDDPVLAGLRYFFLKPLRRQLAAEIEGQFQAFRATGLPLSHLDGHLNIHLHPTVFAILRELMPKYGITSFRLSRERLRPELAVSRRRIAGKAAEAFIFGTLAEQSRNQLERRGIFFTREVKGLLNSGQMTEEYLLRALNLLQEGVTEIYFHPAESPCPEISRRMPGYRHEAELAALNSLRVRQKLQQLGIGLRNYRGEAKPLP
jgi:hopanoid biosynthesis associated protein HpnK